MSSLLVSGATFVSAHETVPTIADLEVVEGNLTFSMRVNVEAFLAGINLDEVTDTDEADEAESYDALRALNAEEIEGVCLGLSMASTRHRWLRSMVRQLRSLF